MGALACMLKELGYEVNGSDQDVYPPMSDFLRSNGIGIQEGFRRRNLDPKPDLVVVGNAVSRENPEVQEMLRRDIPYCSMPQAINRFVASGKRSILVTGTHGKTTTTSMVAWLLYHAGLDPSFFIGGILSNFNSNYRLGQGGYIAIEGDEYDTAFFDKGPKFLHYDPAVAVLTGVEFDHADIFADEDHVKQAFDRFLSGLSPGSRLLVYDGNENAVTLSKDRKCTVEFYGSKADSDWRIQNHESEPPWTHFEVVRSGLPYGSFRSRIIGEHNLNNLLAAIGVCDAIGISRESIASGVEGFAGVRRRQEVRGQRRGITVIDDFAHHPTAVRETIKAVKPFYPKGRLIAVFEPRTNSSMRNVFQDVYPDSFNRADVICIREPSRLDKIPVDERFSSKQLVADLTQKGKESHYFADTSSIIGYLVEIARPRDVVLIMSNGGFDNIHERLLDALD